MSATVADLVGSKCSEAQSFRVEPVEASTFTSRTIAPLKHNFHLHPLLQLDALQNLANFLVERKQCRFVTPGIKLNSSFIHQSEPADGRTLGEVFDRLEEPRSWVALYNVEAHPDYKILLDEIIDSVRPLIDKEQPNIFNIGGFIFISAPPALTPFHIDRENNFWLQIRGQKRLTVFSNTDRDVVSAEAVERYIYGWNLQGVKLTEANANHGREFVVKPGDGVYFPLTTPHMTQTTDEWATPGDGVSVSIGVVFFSDATRRHARICQCNLMLRKLGMEPSEPGKAPLVVETFKAFAGHLFGTARTRLLGYKAPPGAY